MSLPKRRKQNTRHKGGEMQNGADCLQETTTATTATTNEQLLVTRLL